MFVFPSPPAFRMHSLNLLRIGFACLRASWKANKDLAEELSSELKGRRQQMVRPWYDVEETYVQRETNVQNSY